MKNWNSMVSCKDAEFDGLHDELRRGGGLYILDDVVMPDTFGACRCSIEFRYYSERRITLTCVPKPATYTGRDRAIQSWAETGSAEFHGFGALKKFLQSFRNDVDRAPNQPTDPNGRDRKDDCGGAVDETVLEPPEMCYDRESITVPNTSRSLIIIDKDKLAADLKTEIFGQDEAIDMIVHLVCNHLSTKRKLRPLSIFLYGPTGTGKSAVVEALVNEINKRVESARRLAYRPVDCTQFQDRADISRLTGAAPGYVGFDEPGVFSILEDNPNTVFVFEEIEKASSNATEVIMQAMETGRQETNGKTLKNGQSYYDLSNCVIFFTSNVVLADRRNIGFAAQDHQPPKAVQKSGDTLIARRIGDVTKEAKTRLAESGKFRKEVVARMNAIFKFNELSGDVIKDIAAKSIYNLAAKSHLLYVTRIDTPILQEFINATAGEVEMFGVRALRNEAEYYFNDALREYSHGHDDYAQIVLSGCLEQVEIYASNG